MDLELIEDAKLGSSLDENRASGDIRNGGDDLVWEFSQFCTLYNSRST